MKTFTSGGFPAGAVAVLALNCALAAGLSAGEAIKVSSARSRVDPTAKSKLPNGDNGSSAGRVSPLEMMPAGPGRERRDPALIRKDQNAAAEKANWMVLDRGQLDAEDAEKRALGIRDTGTEKDPDKKNYFFAPHEDTDSGSPGKPRPLYSRDRSLSGAEPKDVPTETPKEGTDKEAGRAPVMDKDGRPLGEHTAKELDLKDLLSPGKANSLAPAGDKSALAWREALGGGSEGQGMSRRRDEPSTADSYRGAASFSASRAGETYTVRPEVSSRPAPASSSASDASRGFRAATAPTAPSVPRASDQNFSRSAGAYNPPGANNPYAARAGSSSTDPYSAARTPSQSQRSSSGNFQIPSRHGNGR